MIEAKHLIKDYGTFRAVNDISFKLEKGDVLGFLGPNGAGKSTTMKMLTGFLSPTAGKVSIGDIDISENPIEAKKQFGYLPENCPLYNEMTVIEFLENIAEFRGFRTPAEKGECVEKVIETCYLDNVRYRPIDALSKGYRQRVGMAQAILHDPPYLIMDEPTDGLDPNQKQAVRDLIGSMASEKAIILSTHILEEVEAMCNRVIIIDQGNIIVDETPSDFRKRHPEFNAIELEMDASLKEQANKALTSLDCVKEVKNVDNILRIIPKDGQAIDAEIIKLTSSKKWKIGAFSKPQARLERVFQELTQNEEE
ncbi:MAG: ATP-binding cassette domain-containing protein [Verrucomicrobiota bacterium]